MTDPGNFKNIYLRNNCNVFEELTMSIGYLTIANAVLIGDAYFNVYPVFFLIELYLVMQIHYSHGRDSFIIKYVQ